jgi:hypothetical protein
MRKWGKDIPANEWFLQCQENHTWLGGPRVAKCSAVLNES